MATASSEPASATAGASSPRAASPPDGTSRRKHLRASANGRGFFFDGVEPTEAEAEAAMLREFQDELGEISGAGPYPE